MVIQAVRKAFRIARPEILNSDLGCQFTSNEYKAFLRENHVRQSMDGKSRWADNIMIERWFRSFKYEEAYLTQYNNIREARQAIRSYVKKYNFERCHFSHRRSAAGSGLLYCYAAGCRTGDCVEQETLAAGQAGGMFLSPPRLRLHYTFIPGQLLAVQ